MVGSALVRKSFHHRPEEYDDYEEYDEYEEETSEKDEPEAPKPTMEERNFLKMREQLKDMIRKKLKKQNAGAFCRSQSQDKKGAPTNSIFGSFFGPSQPAIASRVIEESKSIRGTKYIVANMSNSAAKKRDTTSSAGTTLKHQHHQHPEVVNEIKKKAQTLKDMRDYSFLLSDDADLPITKEQPASRSSSAPKSGIHHVPAKLPSIANGLKNTDSSKQHSPSKTESAKEPPHNRQRPHSAESRKVSGAVGNAPGRPISTNVLQRKVPAQVASAKKPLSKIVDDPRLKKDLSTAKSHASAQKHCPEQQRPSQGIDQVKKIAKPSMPPAKSKSSQQNLLHHKLDERPKRRSAERNLNDEEDVDYRSLIREMFRYNPSKYAGIDEDDSDMEVGFDAIQKEERISSKIARKEDEEQLRLIKKEEDRERRMRMRKKQSHG